MCTAWCTDIYAICTCKHIYVKCIFLCTAQITLTLTTTATNTNNSNNNKNNKSSSSNNNNYNNNNNNNNSNNYNNMFLISYWRKYVQKYWLQCKHLEDYAHPPRKSVRRLTDRLDMILTVLIHRKS